MEWLIPSFYGDLELRRAEPTTCTLLIKEATHAEQAAIQTVVRYAVKKGWLLKEVTPDLRDGRIKFTAAIDKVAKQLARALKPGRQLISVVRVGDGKIEEIRESALIVETTVEPKAPAVATTVAAPTIGCPPPDFDRTEIRARRVLDAFLTAEQRDDFRRHNRFVSVGATSGHRYMVTSRHDREGLSRYGGRSLYDLDERQAICVHDWTIPPAEELLTLHLFLQLPGGEQFVRTLPLE